MTQDDDDTPELVDAAGVEQWRAEYVAALAGERTASHNGNGRESTRVLSVGYDLVGLSGEMEIGRLLGQMPPLTQAQDDGHDFWMAALYSVGVKTSRKPKNLLVNVDSKAFSDIYILCAYDDATKRAKPLGWTLRKHVLRAPVGVFGPSDNVPTYYVARGDLRPMEEFAQFRLLKFRP